MTALQGPPPALRCVGMGHSHVVALARGAYEARGSGQTGGDSLLEFHYLHEEAFIPPLLRAGAAERLNPAIHAALARPALDFALLSLGGNEHNALSLAPEPPFDFVAADAQDEPLRAGAWIMPEAAVREALRERMDERLRLAQALRAAFPRLRFVLTEPPPPLPVQIVARRTQEFGASLDVARFADDGLRVKVWRVQAAMLRDLAAELDFAHVGTPPEFVDATGLLSPSAWGEDATHANAAFGRATFLAALGLGVRRGSGRR